LFSSLDIDPVLPAGAAPTGQIMESGRAAGQAPGAAQGRGGAAAQRDKTDRARQNTSSLIY
jgi:hypothetical protein